MIVNPPLKCPHCGADMEIGTFAKPTIYVAMCPKRFFLKHPDYIYFPTVEIK